VLSVTVVSSGNVLGRTHCADACKERNIAAMANILILIR